jgi:hypothetical protein
VPLNQPTRTTSDSAAAHVSDHNEIKRWAEEEVDPALGEGSAAAAALAAHLADTEDAHNASAVSVDPSGLIVVTTSNVQAALAQLDAEVAAGGGGGVTDHGALTGLADDDHLQYHNNARGDARYQRLSAYTQAGSILVGTGSGASAERIPSTAQVSTVQDTASTAYTDLTTAGPAVTVTTGTRAFVVVSAELWNQTAGFSALMSFAVSGATTRAASDADALRQGSSASAEDLAASRMTLVTGLTAGTNTFTSKYRCNGGTGRFLNRSIIVIPL